MPVSKDYLPIAGASGNQTTAATVYQINQSIRFDERTNAYLIKNFSNSNSKTFTFSFWWKIGQHPSVTSARQTIFSAGASAGAAFTLYHNHNSATVDGLTISLTGSAEDFTLTRTFKDPSAWYHVTLACDSTDTVSTNRVRFYINGTRESSFVSASYPSLNSDFYVNYAGGGTNTYWGARAGLNTGEMFDGYLAEINFIDGQALGPEHFGEFNANNLWIPIEYSGTYGTNGYLIQGGTASALGTDTSGNDNNFANSAIQVHDQVLDSPTDNYPVININYRGSSGTTQHYGEVSNGNLFIEHSGAYDGGQLCTALFADGKYYWEVYIVAGGNDSSYQLGSGIAAVNDGYTKSDGRNEGARTGEIGFNSYNGVVKFANSTTKTYTEVPFSNGNILQIAVDADNGAIYYGKNGTFMGSGDPTSGASKTNAGATWTPASYSGGWVPTLYVGGGSVPEIFVNFSINFD